MSKLQQWLEEEARKSRNKQENTTQEEEKKEDDCDEDVDWRTEYFYYSSGSR